MPKAMKVGVVTSNKMDKTAVVSVQRLVRHPLYKRAFKKTSTFMVHDEENRCKIGDRVRIVECRPISKNKHWRLAEILETSRHEPVPAVAGEKNEAATA
jgi:small subunit ribosomal protein S17